MGAACKDDGNQSLTVTDNRTGKVYQIPITRNSIPATAFKAIKADPRTHWLTDRPEDETEQGLRVFDPAFQNTAVVESRITYIDGARGVLRHRGIPIEQLVEKSSFLETAYLIIYGQLPSGPSLKTFEDEVLHHTYLHQDVERNLATFRYDSHPMSILTSAFATLGAFAPEANPSLAGSKVYTNAASGNLEALKLMDKQILRIIGKAPTLAAAAYRVRQGRPFNRPPQGLSYTESLLYSMDHLSGTEYRPNPVFSNALDKLFIIHADHELNCSTATVLQAGSSLVDPYSAVAAGCAALYGPSHGGAAEACVRQLLEIGTPDNVPGFMAAVEKRERVLVGFGHRVYRNVDPRSTAIRKICDDVLKVTGKSPLLETALTLADLASKSEFMRSRQLYPNVDFFSGIIYYAMGIPLDFFPVLFAVPRCVGWLAHWRQSMLQRGGVKIWRPRQVYVGEGERDYVDVDARKESWGASVFDAPVQVTHGGDTMRNRLATYRDEAGKLHTRSRL
ncbi:uncharacterized protein PFL1_05068 [Pseudozyma flocculosa PF-1]|uniref:Citrate synthase n=2 Tax=Pseudozyma flocculosa TaxID=84751 RepID=A0A5C3EW97_9BASI|nr:uncharacterized protein PFL1_05068 [Pseudozyma flocculosa PF-1]EPQ27530.1 hypothetical protein PFL1_05068 [Pseudozyma flocculosa PF-1]SPO36035.1 related to CIT2 - citrate (si)-synthase, peroxisomal [Pseudozyma flocculosa]